MAEKWTKQPDKVLRPWTIDDKLDATIDEKLSALDDCIQKTSGSKIAGCRGQSELDAKPENFIAFERMISDPNWLSKVRTRRSTYTLIARLNSFIYT